MTVDARFWPRCGGRLASRPPTVCPLCSYTMFVNARPTANVIVLDGAEFLSLRRAIEPRAGRWELPGGFCDGWEHPADAAVREAREELGVEVKLGALVGSYVGSYEFQGETLPVLDSFYLADAGGAQIVVNPAEATEMSWFSLADPPPLAFPTMDIAIRAAARSLGIRMRGH
jgi:ADP-ribose pyrophosphatase YjhB (NUDIX family)